MTREFRGTVESGHKGQYDVRVDVTIMFPRTAASDANAAMDLLFNTFPDHEPTLSSEFEDSWIFRLKWASDPLTFVDPEASSAAKNLYGLSLSELGGYREVHRWGGREVVISMIHSWALLAPARAHARRSSRPISWVVHLDDHTDLMAQLSEPISKPRTLRDQIFGENIDIGNPESVAAAIGRGAVNKGNFLTAYLLAYPECRVLHIGRNVTEQHSRLSLQLSAMDLGGRQFTRYEFKSGPCSSSGAWNFQQTRTLPIDLPGGDQEGVWLDIDLDYFCNRYDGDSNRRFEVALPAERDEIRRRVACSLGELSNAEWFSRIEAVSIAVSPGFFPAEYWAEVISTVRDGIRSKLEAEHLHR